MTACIACTHNTQQWLDYRQQLLGDEGRRYSVLVCPCCGTGRTEPAPSDEYLAEIYGGYGSRPMAADGGLRADVLVRMRRAWGKATARVFFEPKGLHNRVLRRLLSCWAIPRVTLPSLRIDLVADRAEQGPLRVLDVGCGNCEFLQLASMSGLKAVGLEVSEDVASEARKLGLDVRAADVASLSGEAFDMVRFSHVLEHLRNPYETLVQAHGLMGKDGYLMVAVPRTPSAITALLGNRAHFHLPFHLYHFTPLGIRRLLERAGFRIVSIKSKSNSILCQSVSRWLGREQLTNHAVMRALCILFEMGFDAADMGGSMEIHAQAV